MISHCRVWIIRPQFEISKTVIPSNLLFANKRPLVRLFNIRRIIHTSPVIRWFVRSQYKTEAPSFCILDGLPSWLKLMSLIYTRQEETHTVKLIIFFSYFVSYQFRLRDLKGMLSSTTFHIFRFQKSKMSSRKSSSKQMGVNL